MCKIYICITVVCLIGPEESGSNVGSEIVVVQSNNYEHWEHLPSV